MQGAMRATFKAINNNTVGGGYDCLAVTLAPVGASHLAQRRGRNRPKSSTEL